MKKLTLLEVNRRLTEINIKLIGPYINQRTPTDFQCMLQKCLHTWKVAPTHLIHHHSGCPKCNDTKLTNEIIDGYLLQYLFPIKRIGDYINADIPISFLCLKPDCQNQWTTLTTGILHRNGKGCAKCHYRSISLTEEEVDNRLYNMGIKRLTPFLGTDTLLTFQCLDNKCSSIWTILPGKTLTGERGCPGCSQPNNEKIVRLFLTRYSIIFRSQFPIYINTLGIYPIKPDFYIPSLNLIIEYNGGQHYQVTRFLGQTQDAADKAFIKQQVRDQALREYCQEHNINLLEIDGRKYKGKRLVQFLTNYFTDIAPTLKQINSE